MIEAMACGTPVIAFRRGSVPEVIDEGVTGFIVDNEDEAVAAIKRIGELDRQRVRARFEERFTARRMAEDYLRHYDCRARRAVRPFGCSMARNWRQPLKGPRTRLCRLVTWIQSASFGVRVLNLMRLSLRLLSPNFVHAGTQT